MLQTYFIKTFGCAQNTADSERIASYLEEQGMKKAKNINDADKVIVNTCMVREMAENRVYGLVNNLVKLKTPAFAEASAGRQNSKLKTITADAGSRCGGTTQNLKLKKPKIILTGCMVGMAVRDKTGKLLRLLKKRMPAVDEFLPIEEIGFDCLPLRTDKLHALVPISNGCNNFCTYCVVPYTRGREVSRPYDEIIEECRDLAKKGYKKITLLGQNVNSYGADLLLGSENVQVLRDINKRYFENSKFKMQNSKLQFKIKNLNLIENCKLKIENFKKKPIYVKHLGRYRIPTLFPYLLKEVCKIEGIEEIDFMSSNPWDFSDELIDVIARNIKITRNIHLPVQSGSNSVLKRMNRWYTRDEYLQLVANLKLKIKNLKLSTDIIVGFCGETKEEFQQTVDLCKKVGFYKAYIARYSDRPMTAAHKAFKDNVPHPEKKRRWKILEDFINKPNLRK